MDAELLATPLYAGIFGLMLLTLSVAVIRRRRKLGIPLLHGDHPDLVRVVRAHANFVEYIPFTLFLMLLIELNGAERWLMHGLGGLLLLGRLCHIYGILHMEQPKEGQKPSFSGRVAGMMFTFAALVIASAMAIYQFIEVEMGLLGV